MADMAKKLRENAVAVPHDVYSWFNPLLNEAAAEIERLRAALRPFAECAAEDETEIDYLVSKPGAVAAARAAYEQQEPPK